ncbi:uncharacterized protein LOC141640751 [Silene latifolia]|uniref:uncharacterized protein LOC141640751 n=1 Tax=Silene latifolia TaxID=37657 RepID=UPI003D76BE4D
MIDQVFCKEGGSRVEEIFDDGGSEGEQMRWIRESKPVFVIESPGSCECVRIMVDAGWKDLEKGGGWVGWVAFSPVGHKLFEVYVAIKAESALQAEALGIREVFSWAKRKGLWHLEVSSDCLHIIACLAEVSRPHHHIRAIIDDILCLSSGFHCLSFSFIPRTFNKIAHGLACKAMIS